MPGTHITDRQVRRYMEHRRQGNTRFVAAAIRQWAGRSFDPERFGLAKTDKAVRSALRKARKDYIFRRD